MARGLAASYGARPLFAGLDLVVAPSDVVGLVGVNGAGKSTLLRILAGLRVPDSGRVRLNPPHATVAYLAQEIGRRDGEDVAAFLARRTGVAQAEHDLEQASAALAEGGTAANEAYEIALARFVSLGAADLADRTGAVLADLGLAVDTAIPMTSLSGGQAARVGLAALLLSRYDILLLDEPTNDLDLDGLDRLERFVDEQRSGIVLVSHDREFLGRTVTGIVELDLAQQRVGVFGGGYEAYLTEREVVRRHAREEYDEYARTRAGLEDRARTQRSWMDAGIRNATLKARDNDKIGRKKRVEQTEKQAAKARQTERLIERLPEVAEPRKEWQLRYAISAAPRSGSVVAVAHEAVVRRGHFILGPITVQVDAGDRIGITGPNGSGKTTLLSVLLGRQRPDSGRASLGSSVAIGEVDQARGMFGGRMPLMQAFGEQLPDYAEADIRTLLAKFGLTAEHVTRPSDTLTPGERTRAAMALLQARGVNVLVLDEPTNHLDLAAIEQLEAALDAYTGTLLLVTHDRRMLENVRLNRQWHVDDGRLTET